MLSKSWAKRHHLVQQTIHKSPEIRGRRRVLHRENSLSAQALMSRASVDSRVVTNDSSGELELMFDHGFAPDVGEELVDRRLGMEISYRRHHRRNARTLGDE